MATHKIVLQVVVVMDEMDGSADESAEIALEQVADAIHEAWDANAVVTVTDYQEV